MLHANGLAEKTAGVYDRGVRGRKGGGRDPYPANALRSRSNFFIDSSSNAS
jgi:hypothetical protein